MRTRRGRVVSCACAPDTASACPVAWHREAVLGRPVSLPGQHSKQELLGLIEAHRQGLLALIGPVTLLYLRVCHPMGRYSVPDRVVKMRQQV